MGLGENLKKLIHPENPEEHPGEIKERPLEGQEKERGTVRIGATVEPLSDEERARLIEEARSDLPELDRQVEKNLDRLRELSRS